MIRFRKVGGLRFWRIGRLGGSFYLAARRALSMPAFPILFDNIA